MLLFLEQLKFKNALSFGNFIICMHCLCDYVNVSPHQNLIVATGVHCTVRCTVQHVHECVL